MLRKTIALFALLTVLAMSLPVSTQASLPNGTRITFTIRGKGHGVGMSMAGVYGMATHSKGYRDIVNYYYPSTRWSSIDDNKVISVKCEDGVRRNYRIKSYLYRLAEEPDSWPREGLRSLMVAARTYLWYKVKKHGYMPGGQYFVHTIDPSTRPHIVAAVNDTKGKIKTYSGNPLLAAYSGSSGGYTAAFQDTWPGGSTYPYLIRRPSPYDKYISSSWLLSKVRTIQQIRNAYPSAGGINNIRVTRRNGRGSWGGRVLNVRIYGTRRTLNVHGWAFATALGLNSSMFTFSVRPPLNIYASRYRIRKGRAVRIFGYLYPKHNGIRITTYIYKGKKRYYHTATLYGSWSDRSRYEWVFRPGATGTYRLQSRFPGDSDHLSSRSRTIYIRVL